MYCGIRKLIQKYWCICQVFLQCWQRHWQHLKAEMVSTVSVIFLSAMLGTYWYKNILVIYIVITTRDDLLSHNLNKCLVNTLRPRQDGCRLPDDIFKCIFVNENVLILIKISLKFVPKFRINNIPALVKTMAWGRPGDKPLSRPMMVNLLTHICVTWPQWVNINLYMSNVLRKH